MEAQKVSSNALNYIEILEKIGYGKSQWILLLISGILTVCSMAGLQCMGIIVITSECEFQTTQAEKGIMMAIPVVGVLISTYILGFISDTIGRRKVLLYGTFLSNALHFILMFVPSLWLFNLINLLCGLSLGAVSGVIYAYLGEFHEPRHRAIAINYSTMFVSVAAIYVPATSWLVLSSDWSFNIVGDFIFKPWRLILLLTLLPGLIGALLLIYYPESPMLLLSQNKEIEAIDAVNWICKFNRGISVNEMLNCSEFHLNLDTHNNKYTLKNRKGCGIIISIAKATVLLFQKPHGYGFMLCSLTMSSLFFSNTGLRNWYPEIVNRAYTTGFENSSTICQMLDNSYVTLKEYTTLNNTWVCSDIIATKTYMDNIVVGVVFLIGFLVQGTLLKFFEQNKVLLGGLLIGTFCNVLKYFVSNVLAALVLLAISINVTGLSITMILSVTMDLLPTNLRGGGISFALSLGRLAIVGGTSLVGLTLQPYCESTFALLAILIFAALVFSYLLPLKNSK